MEFAASSKAGVDKIIQIQNESANFLLDRLRDLENAGLLENENPKLLNVAVQSSDFQSMDNSSSISVISIVSLVYESTEQKQLLLEQTLDLAISKGPKVYNFSFTKEFVSFRFKPVEDDSEVVYVPEDDDDNVGSEIALIIACSILSIMLVLVSGVLLFISGGWDSCKNRCINCLFEEVEDEYVVTTKNNNQTNVHPTYDDEDEEEEEQSVTTSPAPTTASGVLGAYGQPNPLAAALGIRTPGRHDTESMMTYDDDDIGMTPMSASSNPQPLGITSMRKLPAPDTPDTQRGFAGLIKQRFASNSRN